MMVSEGRLQNEGADSRYFGPTFSKYGHFHARPHSEKKLILNREAMKFPTGATAGFRNT